MKDFINNNKGRFPKFQSALNKFENAQKPQQQPQQPQPQQLNAEQLKQQEQQLLQQEQLLQQNQIQPRLQHVQQLKKREQDLLAVQQQLQQQLHQQMNQQAQPQPKVSSGLPTPKVPDLAGKVLKQLEKEVPYNKKLAFWTQEGHLGKAIRDAVSKSANGTQQEKNEAVYGALIQVLNKSMDKNNWAENAIDTYAIHGPETRRVQEINKAKQQYMNNRANVLQQQQLQQQVIRGKGELQQVQLGLQQFQGQLNQVQLQQQQVQGQLQKIPATTTV